MIRCIVKLHDRSFKGTIGEKRKKRTKEKQKEKKRKRSRLAHLCIVCVLKPSFYLCSHRGTRILQKRPYDGTESPPAHLALPVLCQVSLSSGLFSIILQLFQGLGLCLPRVVWLETTPAETYKINTARFFKSVNQPISQP